MGTPMCLPRLRRVGQGISEIFQDWANIAFVGYALQRLRQHDFFDFQAHALQFENLPNPINLCFFPFVCITD